MSRTGGWRKVRGKYYCRVRTGQSRRPSIAMPAVHSDDAATARAALIAAAANLLIEAGHAHQVKAYATALGAAKTDAELRIIRLAVERVAKSGPRLTSKDIDVATFAQRWTSGELARDWPDHVPTKDPRGDKGIIAQYINPLVGPEPLVEFDLDHADAVMRALPASLGAARRRHVAQVLHRICALAAFPARLIKTSPIPKGWLPRIGKGKAKQYLYPDEDRRLLACRKVDIERRLLYGVLAREGMRASEALALEWSDVDTARGAINLDENKTDDPRAWALDPSVARALAWWREHGAPERGPFAAITSNHLAKRFRSDLEVAKVKRAALFENNAKQSHIRAHDLRATFITLSLANGRTEQWVQDRTGHASTLMIARYRRIARTVAELHLGPLAPLDEAIPEMGGDQVGIKRRSKRSRRTR